MAFLTAAELPTYYPAAANMKPGDVTEYLYSANAYAKGKIGGTPPEVDEDLKVAVAIAFKILALGKSSQVNAVNGNITAAAPSNEPADKNPLAVVDVMLVPYQRAYAAANVATASRGIMFL